MKNTALGVKILLQKRFTEIMEKLVLENQYKIAQQFYNDLSLYQLC